MFIAWGQGPLIEVWGFLDWKVIVLNFTRNEMISLPYGQSVWFLSLPSSDIINLLNEVPALWVHRLCWQKMPGSSEYPGKAGKDSIWKPGEKEQNENIKARLIGLYNLEFICFVFVGSSHSSSCTHEIYSFAYKASKVKD